MGIKYGSHDLVKRIIDWHEVEKVMYNGSQIRPNIVPPTPSAPTFSLVWDFTQRRPIDWRYYGDIVFWNNGAYTNTNGTNILECITPLWWYISQAKKIIQTVNFSWDWHTITTDDDHMLWCELYNSVDDWDSYWSILYSSTIYPEFNSFIRYYENSRSRYSSWLINLSSGQHSMGNLYFILPNKIYILDGRMDNTWGSLRSAEYEVIKDTTTFWVFIDMVWITVSSAQLDIYESVTPNINIIDAEWWVDQYSWQTNIEMSVKADMPFTVNSNSPMSASIMANMADGGCNWHVFLTSLEYLSDVSITLTSELDSSISTTVNVHIDY